MKVVEVIPIKRGLPQETLTYFSSENIEEGTIVSITIKSKLVDAIVVNTKNALDEKAALKSGSFSLKKIVKIKKDNKIPSYIFETAKIASNYYRKNPGDILKLIVPDFAIQGSFIKNINQNNPKNNDRKSIELFNDKPQPERLIFQSPLVDRISFYKTYIREAFARKESITIVCPTISDCDFFAENLSRGITDFVVILHSEVLSKRFIETINKLASSTHSYVLITTPAFATFMRDDLGTFILEHESSSAYNTPSNPSYDFRVLIEILARTSKIKLIVSDSLLRVETLGRYEAKEFGTVSPVTFREITPIEISIISDNMPEIAPTKLNNEQMPAFYEFTQKIINKAFQKKSHIFCLAVRTGLATITKCRDCNSVLICEFCSTPLVLYQNSYDKKIFICNKCKRHKPSESKCMRCGSWNLSAFGIGTEYVENEIRRIFPEMPVFRIDRETTSTRAKAYKVAEQFLESEKGILVGTEMALYYLSKKVDDSIIVSFDTLFNIPSYKTDERIVNLILSITEKTKNNLYIQTKKPNEPIIEMMQKNNYANWYRNELAERIEYNYPPATTIIKLTWYGKNATQKEIIDKFNDIFSKYSPDIFTSEIIQKSKKYEAVNVIIRPKRSEYSHFGLLDSKNLSENILEAFSKMPEGTIININPENLL